jgi:hypothetical protein
MRCAIASHKWEWKRNRATLNNVISSFDAFGVKESMRRHLMIPTLASLLCLPAAAQRPAAEDQKRVLDAARDHAIHYTSKLPDFICTEQVERNDSVGSHNSIDRLIVHLSYSGQHEKYKLVSMNGSPSKESLASLGGLITAGEFGSQLAGIFNPSSSAEFKWKESTTIRKHTVAVYTYRVARTNSHYMVGDRADDGKIVSEAAGYHGEVFLDSQTSGVLRLTAEADDIPKDSGILQSSVHVDYDLVDIAGRKYLLPFQSGSSMERGYRKLSNTVKFTDYQKFAADSTIDFKE